MDKRSSRHKKIIGDFGEHLVRYWLSKHGFECASVDHTGIDLIARNSKTKELMGISVKSRSRKEGKEYEPVTVKNDNFKKAAVACDAFGCVPYMAIVVDAGEFIRAFIMPTERFLKLSSRGKTINWKMTEANVDKYYDDKTVKVFEMKTQTISWW